MCSYCIDQMKWIYLNKNDMVRPNTMNLSMPIYLKIELREKRSKDTIPNTFD